MKERKDSSKNVKPESLDTVHTHTHTHTHTQVV